MGGWHMDVGGGWWIVGPIMMIVFWGGLFWLFANVIGGRRPDPASGDTPISAKEIAARRFASGEIDQAEYSRISNLLEG